MMKIIKIKKFHKQVEKERGGNGRYKMLQKCVNLMKVINHA